MKKAVLHIFNTRASAISQARYNNDPTGNKPPDKGLEPTGPGGRVGLVVVNLQDGRGPVFYDGPLPEQELQVLVKDLEYRGRGRDGKLTRSTGVAANPIRDTEGRKEAVRHIAEDSVRAKEVMAPGAKYIIWVHTDKEHVHSHDLVENLDLKTGKRLEWNPTKVEKWQGLSWAKHFESGRGTGLAHEVQRVGRRADLLQRLAGELKAGKTVEELAREGRLSGKFRTKAGGPLRHPSIRFEGKVFRLDGLTAWAKKEGIKELQDSTVFQRLDGRHIETKSPTPAPIESVIPRQNNFELPRIAGYISSAIHVAKESEQPQGSPLPPPSLGGDTHLPSNPQDFKKSPYDLTVIGISEEMRFKIYRLRREWDKRQTEWAKMEEAAAAAKAARKEALRNTIDHANKKAKDEEECRKTKQFTLEEGAALAAQHLQVVADICAALQNLESNAAFKAAADALQKVVQADGSLPNDEAETAKQYRQMANLGLKGVDAMATAWAHATETQKKDVAGKGTALEWAQVLWAAQAGLGLGAAVFSAISPGLVGREWITLADKVGKLFKIVKEKSAQDKGYDMPPL